MQNPEQAREGARDIRTELLALRDLVGEELTPDERKKRFTEITTSLTAHAQQFRERTKELEKAFPGIAKNELYKKRLAVQQELIGEAMAGATLNPLDTVRALVEVNAADPRSLDDLQKNFAAGDIDNELKALNDLIVEAKGPRAIIKGLFDKLGINDEKVKSFGVTQAEAIDFVVGYLYSMMEPLPFIGQSVMVWRESDAMTRADMEGIDEAAKKKGRETWTKEYAEWMKNPGGKAAPDLYGHMLAAQEAARKEAADAKAAEAEKQELEKISATANANKLFGANVTIIVEKTGAPVAEHVGPDWKITMGRDHVGADGSALNGETVAKMKTAINKLRARTDIVKISIGDGWEMKKATAGNEVTWDGDKDIAAIVDLAPKGSVESVGGLPSDDTLERILFPGARWKGGKVLVSSEVLNDANARASLMNTMQNVTAEKEYKFEGGSWNAVA